MVKLVAPRLIDRSRPCHLGANTDIGSRIGGFPPDGVRPRRVHELTVYFGTIAFAVDSDREVSIFLTDEDNALLRGGQVYSDDVAGAVEIVLHGRSRRGSAALLASPLSGRAIVIGAEQDDWYVTEDGRVPIGRHKMGGRPSIHKEWDLEGVCAELQQSRYVQVVQLDFPGPEDLTGIGSWPFGDGMFHILAREPFDPQDWIWFWEN